MALTKVTGDFIKDGVLTQAHLHTSHGITTAHIGEGSNLYFTNARVDSRIGDLSTSNLSEGSNLYYTQARFNTAFAAKSTSDLSEGTNLYYTDTRVGSYLTTNSYATQSYVNTQVSNLVDSAPSTLDTLNELAAALGDDANFSTTVTNSIATKLPLAGGTLTGGLSGTSATFSGNIVGYDEIKSRGQIRATGWWGSNSSSENGHALEIGVSPSTSTEAYILSYNRNNSSYGDLNFDAVNYNFNQRSSGTFTYNGANIIYVGQATYNNSNWDTAYGWGNHASAGYLASSSYTAADVLSKILTVDGPGSGLNADLLDGVDSTSFLRSDAADTATGQLFFDAGFDSHPIMLSGAVNFDNVARSGFYNLYGISGATSSPGITYGTMIAIGNDKGSSGFGLQIAHERTGAGMYVRGMNDTASAWSAWAEIWTSTTDGSGSGLDADLLDGQHASAFASSSHTHAASDITSGNLAAARNTVNLVNIASTANATGIYFRSANEIISGETYALAFYGYNNNDGFLFFNRDSSGNATPVFHIGGHNNASTAGYSAEDGMITLNRNDGSKGTNTALGLTTSSYRTRIVKTTTKTIFADTQSSHEFTGTVTANTDVRSPIFYDSNNTSFYVDPSNAGTNISINTAGIIRGNYFVGTNYAADGYTIYKGYDNWNHFIVIRGLANPGSSKAQSSIAGGHQTSFVEYAESNATTGWFFVGSAGSTYEQIAKITKSHSEFVGSARAPLFYDTNNTAYYIDPSSTSQVNTIEFEASGNNGRFVGYSGWGTYHYTDSGYILFGPANTSHAHIYTDRPNFYTNAPIIINGGTELNSGDVRSPIYYDSNNTSRYVDPNGNSLVQEINLYGQLQMQRGQANNAIWWAANTDQNHAVWNDYYGGPTTRGAANSGFDGIKWNTYRGLHIRGGSAGAYNCMVITNTSSNTNTHTVALYAHDDEVLKTTNSSNNGIIVQRDLYLSGSTGGSTGNQLVIGQTSQSLTYTLQDTNTRPLIYMTGQYPAITLNHTVTGNTNHGPTIQYTFNGSNNRQWVHGASGDGEHFDLGYSDSNQGNTNYNPHNGIAGYSGVTFMTFKSNGNIGIGSAGDWGGLGSGDPAYAIDTRGTLYNNTDVRTPVFYDSNNTAYYVDINNSSNFNHIMIGNGNANSGAQSLALNDGEVAFRDDADHYHKMWYYDGVNIATNRAHGHVRIWGENSNTIRNASTGASHLVADFDCAGDVIYLYNDTRSPIFRDSANTNYYVDPASGTNLNGNTRIYNTKFGVSTSGSFNFGTGYGFHTIENGSSNEPICVFYNQVATTSVQHYGINIISAGDHNNTTSRFMAGQGGSTERIKIYSNGNIQNSNNSYGQLSDINLKENIVDATPKLDELNQIRVVNFNYIGDVDEETNTPNKQIGVIAQEVEQIFPGLVYECGDTEVPTKSVKYSVFVPMMLKAMQEQQTIIDDLKSRIETLENQ